MSFAVKTDSKQELRVHVLVDGRPLCGGGHGARSATHWQQEIGPANCKACLGIIKQKETKVTKKGQKMSKTQEIEKTQDFADLVSLLAVYSSANNELTALESTVNGELLELVDDHKKDYATFQEALTKSESAIELIVRRHPEWFVGRKSVKTPYGTAKLHSATKLEPVNEEATVKLLRAEAKSNPEFKADDFIRVNEVPNLEALEGLDDEQLKRFMVKRVKEEKFSVTPAKVDMGKAVKEAVEKQQAAA